MRCLCNWNNIAANVDVEDVELNNSKKKRNHNPQNLKRLNTKRRRKNAEMKSGTSWPAFTWQPSTTLDATFHAWASR
jgi:hypothetical protein